MRILLEPVKLGTPSSRCVLGAGTLLALFDCDCASNANVDSDDAIIIIIIP